jgi:hypothetical protein
MQCNERRAQTNNTQGICRMITYPAYLELVVIVARFLHQSRNDELGLVLRDPKRTSRNSIRGGVCDRIMCCTTLWVVQASLLHRPKNATHGTHR